jgi:hypothetical protein
MKQAKFEILGEINALLPTNKRGTGFIYTFQGEQSVKHLIESLGIPHTEVGQIQANGHQIDFRYIVQDNDRITVLPISFDNRPPVENNLVPEAQQDRFVLDNHLGRLAFYLRMLGFDCLYRNDYQDELLAHVSHQQGRILLTRDRRLLMRNSVIYGYLVRSKMPRQQLVEVLRRYDLYDRIAPFRRCMRCNGLLQEVRKDEVFDRLQPLTRKYFDDFRICPQCGQIYWKGSHYERMMQIIGQVAQPQTDQVKSQSKPQ